MNDRSPRPTADEIVTRLLDAVETLCARGSPADATMRAIASEAGLSVGAAYRYFESRDTLLGAAMERMGTRLAEAGARHEDPTALITALWRALEENVAFARLATWLAMTGRTPSDVMASHPLARTIAEGASAKGMADPPGIAAVVLFLTLSTVAFRPAFNRAVGRDPGDRRLDHDLAEMFALWMAEHGVGAARADGTGGPG